MGNSESKKPSFASQLGALGISLEAARENKLEVCQIANEPLFKASFYELFSFGGFSVPNAESRDGDFAVKVVRVDKLDAEGRSVWQAKFLIRTRSVLGDSSVWRNADIIEVISAWDRYHPLMLSVLAEDKAHLERVERAVEHLRDILAPDVMRRYLGTLKPFAP